MTADISPAGTDRRRHRYAGRVLIVTGSRPDSDLYGDALVTAGFCTLYTSDASDAYQIASHVTLSVIVTGSDLEGQSADELTRCVRANPRLKHLPLVFFGGNARRSESDGKPATTDGFQVIFPEACTPGAFAAVIGAVAKAPRTERPIGRVP